MKKIASLTAGIMAFAPMAAFAQYTVRTGFIDSVLNLVAKLISFAFPALTAVAVIVFVYSMIRYILASAEDKTKDRKGLVYSLFALFIIVSLFGILKLVQNITGTGGNNTIDATQVPRVDLTY